MFVHATYRQAGVTAGRLLIISPSMKLSLSCCNDLIQLATTLPQIWAIRTLFEFQRQSLISSRMRLRGTILSLQSAVRGAMYRREHRNTRSHLKSRAFSDNMSSFYFPRFFPPFFPSKPVERSPSMKER